MKKLVALFFCVGLMALLSTQAYAQVKFNNKTGKWVQVCAGAKELLFLQKGNSGTANLPADRKADLTLRFDGFSGEEKVLATKAADQAEYDIIAGADKKPYLSPVGVTPQSSSPSLSPPSYTPPAPYSSASGSVQTTKVTLKNSSGMYFMPEDGPFAGVCLAPGDASKSAVDVPQGPLQFSVLATDSAANKVLAKATIFRMIAQSATEIEVKQADFNIVPGRDKVKYVIANAASVEILGISDPANGVAVGPGTMKKPTLYRTKVNSSTGFKDLTFQFYDFSGQKRVATINALIVNGEIKFLITDEILRRVSTVR